MASFDAVVTCCMVVTADMMVEVSAGCVRLSASRAKPGPMSAARCTIAVSWAAIDIPLILWQLHDGAKRHGELRRSIAGVSEKVLTQQLRELQSHGIVHREVFAEVPPRVEYSLTTLGLSLNDALRTLGDWGEEHAEHIIGLSAEK